ncbi:MAG TPA: hypothetical protein PKY22_12080 [Accumulibacter sp.]|nr:hypothetical protein [Accumulibacter sp.]
MVRGFQIIGLLAMLLFAYAQYQGWNLFDREANTQKTHHSGGSGGRFHHK